MRFVRHKLFKRASNNKLQHFHTRRRETNPGGVLGRTPPPYTAKHISDGNFSLEITIDMQRSVFAIASV
jgi:hypothetical protein